jgi:mono/diheme cytochrome c family protein
MLALSLTLALAAAPNVRVTYELKCLYCHSAEVTERRRLTEPGWVKLIEKMRKKAPLLITRREVRQLARFMARERGLVPASSKRPKPNPEETPVAEPEPPPLPEPEPAAAVSAPEEPETDPALEQQGFALMQQRCSKCHTLSRVYTKLDGLERTLAVIERMQLKTGSGITDSDLKTLDGYVRSQFSD